MKILKIKQYYTDKELEKQWFQSQKRYSSRELLKIFPEVKPYLENKLKELKKTIVILYKQIKSHLEYIFQTSKNQSDFTIWFRKKIVYYLLGGENWEKCLKKHKQIWWLLNPPKKNFDESITDEMIERARQQNIENFIEPAPKNHFSPCPFHSEQKASFYTKNNFGFCFGCNWNGDIIKFIMDKEKLSFKETIKILQ